MKSTFQSRSQSGAQQRNVKESIANLPLFLPFSEQWQKWTLVSNLTVHLLFQVAHFCSSHLELDSLAVCPRESSLKFTSCRMVVQYYSNITFGRLSLFLWCHVLLHSFITFKTNSIFFFFLVPYWLIIFHQCLKKEKVFLTVDHPD